MPEVKTASPAARTRAAGSKAGAKASSKNGTTTGPGVRAAPPAKKSAVKKAVAKKSAVKKVVAKKPVAKKAVAKKPTAKKPTAKKVTAKQASTKATIKKAVKKAPPKRAATSSTRVRLPVRPGEDPWTKAERDEVRADLDVDRSRLLGEVTAAEHGIQLLLRDGGDGAGNDQADVGSNALERDAEMSLANNSREMLFQVERALSRLEDGSYGVCESCGEPIGKLRLMAFPRATLCVSCKQRQERR